MSTATPVPLQPTKRAYILWLALGLVLVLLIAVAVAWQGTAKVRALKGSNEDFLAWNKHQSGVKTTASGLEVQVLKPGEGPTATDQDVAIVNYVGKLRDGRIFDQSRQPTPLPVSGMIPGFSEALKMMQKGGKYRLWIKPELGYGEKSPDPETIPPGSMLVFDVELVRTMPLQQFQQMMMMQQMQQQQQGAGAPPPPGAPGGQ